MYNRQLGQVTARLAYDYIASSHCQETPEKIFVSIWNFNLPLKVICFAWLCLSNRISTWANLLKKGWTGPSCCCLCMRDVESVNHFFVDCRFTREVIDGLGTYLHRNINWNEPTYMLNMVKWTANERELRFLPLLMT